MWPAVRSRPIVVVGSATKKRQRPRPKRAWSNVGFHSRIYDCPCNLIHLGARGVWLRGLPCRNFTTAQPGPHPPVPPRPLHPPHGTRFVLGPGSPSPGPFSCPWPWPFSPLSCVVLASHPSPSHRFTSARYKSRPHSRLGSPALPVWFSVHPAQPQPNPPLLRVTSRLDQGIFRLDPRDLSHSPPPLHPTARAITAKFISSKFSFAFPAFESCLVIVSRLDPSHTLFTRQQSVTHYDALYPPPPQNLQTASA